MVFPIRFSRIINRGIDFASFFILDVKRKNGKTIILLAPKDASDQSFFCLAVDDNSNYFNTLGQLLDEAKSRRYISRPEKLILKIRYKSYRKRLKNKH